MMSGVQVRVDGVVMTEGADFTIKGEGRDLRGVTVKFKDHVKLVDKDGEGLPIHISYGVEEEEGDIYEGWPEYYDGYED